MKKDNPQHISSILFYLAILIGLTISSILIYADIESSAKLSKEVKSNLLVLGYLDQLNTSVIFIERNEKPYLIAANNKMIDEIINGYNTAFDALENLKKAGNAGILRAKEVLLLDSFIREKIKLSGSLIRLSKNRPDSAIKLLNSSKDQEIVTGYVNQYNTVYASIKEKVNKLQESHIAQTKKVYQLLVLILASIFFFVTYNLLKLINQIKLKDKFILQNNIFSNIINNSFDSIVTTDLKFKIDYCNSATEEIYGIKKEDIYGKECDDAFETLGTKESIEDRKNKVVKDGFWIGELQRKDKLGKLIQLHTSIKSIKDQHGKTIGYFCINTDITSLKNSKNEIKKLVASLAEANKGLEQKVLKQATIINDVLKRIRDVVIGTDAYYNITYASGHVNSVFGVDEKELIGKNFRKLFAEISIADNNLPEINEEENVRNFEFLHLRNLRWFEANIYTSAQGCSLYFNDKTETKKSVEEIIKSKQMYEFISKANEIILHAKNRDEIYSQICEMAVTFDDILFAWVGVSNEIDQKIYPAHRAGKEDDYLNAIKNISSADIPEGRGPCGKAFREGKYYYSNDIANDPAMIIWKGEALKRGFRSSIALPLKVYEKVVAVLTMYTSKPFYFTDEQIDLVVNTADNISFALQAFHINEQRKTSEAELQKVLKAVEQSSASIMITDIKGNIEYVNPAFSKLTGYSFEEVIGKNPRISKTGHTTKKEYAELWNTITHKAAWSGEFCNKKKNGEIYWEYAVISPVVNDEGEITNYVAVKENITERKILEEQQKKISADLLRRNRDLEQFSYILSHNIRGPLSNILGLKAALLKRIVKGEEHMLLEGISESADSMDKVIKDMSLVLNLRKVSMDEKENVSFNKLVHTIREDINNIILKKSAHITVDFTKAPGCYSINSYLKSIFYNLIINALKFAKLDQSPEIQIWSEIEKDIIKIHFKDYGIGIDLSRYGNSIFGLYKRFNLNIEGRGLGLFMVKTQVEFLGGEIQVQSKLNEWTEFIISLPINNPDSEL